MTQFERIRLQPRYRRPADPPSPLRIIRTSQLAELLGVHVTTIWRWRQEGILPQPIVISGGVRGWPETVILDWLKEREGGHD